MHPETFTIIGTYVVYTIIGISIQQRFGNRLACPLLQVPIDMSGGRISM